MNNSISFNIEKLKFLLDSPFDCFWVVDITTTRFIYVSPAVFTQLGWTVDEVMNLPIDKIFSPKSLQKLMNEEIKRYHRFINGDRHPEIVSSLGEYEQYCKDGSIISVEISTHLVNDEQSGAVVVGLTRDATKRKNYENHLLNIILTQQEKIRELQESHHSQPTLIVRFFGKFVVNLRGSTLPIKWRTTKTEELLAFLLQHDQLCVSRNSLIDALWPETDGVKAAKYLHTTLYNLKKDLKTHDIAFDWQLINGSYCFSLPDYSSDLQEYKAMIKLEVTPQTVLKILQVLETIDVVESFSTKSIHKIEAGIRLYQGDFLEENGYLWAATQRADYRSLFEKTLYTLAHYYFLIHDYPSCRRVVFRLIDLDNLNETYHEMLLKIYIFENNIEAFIDHYDDLKALLQSELNQPPDTAIFNLYQQCQQNQDKRQASSKHVHYQPFFKNN